MKSEPYVPDTPLKCDPVLQTERGWLYDLSNDEHICFSLDGERYFLFPLGDRKYGFNTWRALSENGGYPSHTFDTFDEVLDAKLFNGRSIRERLDEILVYDQA